RLSAAVGTPLSGYSSNPARLMPAGSTRVVASSGWKLDAADLATLGWATVTHGTMANSACTRAAA
ncbi:MAG: hypothetical protein QG597_2032, partial [Actinomycetota bacterium]|nr:hypothetical protein [Actinomycetota bacterium]